MPPAAQQFTSLPFVSLFSLILSRARDPWILALSLALIGVLINATTDDDGLVVRTLCDRGPILFKCTIIPRIPNAKESLLAALQDW